MNVLIIDNFFDNPEEIVEQSLDQDYNCSKDIDSGWQGYRTARLEPSPIQEKILQTVSDHFKIQNHNIESYYHILPIEVIHWDAQWDPATRVRDYHSYKYHADPVPYAGVIYLSDAPENCGTSVVNGERNQIVSYPHKYNRLIAYPGYYVHAPTSPYGKDITDGRLTYNFFISQNFYGF